MVRVKLYTDGGVRAGKGGSSGIGGLAWIIRTENGEKIKSGAIILEDTTVNEAEYSGLIEGLYRCAELGARDVTVYLDSQLVVNQMNYVWACRSEVLQEFVIEVRKEIAKFDSVDIQWIPRHLNSAADFLCRENIDKYLEQKKLERNLSST